MPVCLWNGGAPALVGGEGPTVSADIVADARRISGSSPTASRCGFYPELRLRVLLHGTMKRRLF